MGEGGNAIALCGWKRFEDDARILGFKVEVRNGECWTVGSKFDDRDAWQVDGGRKEARHVVGSEYILYFHRNGQHGISGKVLGGFSWNNV